MWGSRSLWVVNLWQSADVQLFGLTGGIASGKSTVGARFQARGLPVLDADRIARDVVAVGSSGLAELVLRFGPEVLGPDDALDRKKLGALVFADPDARLALNAIVHPRIAQRTQELREELTRAGHDLACYEAALLVENGLAAAFQPLVVVTASPALQLARIAARDGLGPAEAEQRLRAQAPVEAKLAVARYVIENQGELPALHAEADRVLDAVCDELGLAHRPRAHG